MAIAPKLGDGESFVQGRSIALAKELIEKAEAAGLSASVVVTVSHGYVVPSEILEAKEADADADADEADEEEQVEEFDPSESNVADVKAYLDGADEKERERVLAAEAAGKNRDGVLSYSPKESK